MVMTVLIWTPYEMAVSKSLGNCPHGHPNLGVFNKEHQKNNKNQGDDWVIKVAMEVETSPRVMFWFKWGYPGIA